MDTLQFDEAVRVLKTACQTKTVLVDDVIRCLDIIDGSSTVPAKVKGKHCHQTHTAWEAGCFVAMVSDDQSHNGHHHIQFFHFGLFFYCSDFPTVVNGRWRLVFAVPAPIPPWAYIPVIEDCAIDTRKGSIVLTSYLGPFTFSFFGSCSFSGQSDMNFSFTSSEIEVFGYRKTSQREGKPKLKTYSFFYTDEEIAAVNSSATGGKTLMLRLK